MYAAAKKWEVPRSSLRSKVKGINPMTRKMGAPTVFSSSEGKILEEWVLDCFRRKCPVSNSLILILNQT